MRFPLLEAKIALIELMKKFTLVKVAETEVLFVVSVSPVIVYLCVCVCVRERVCVCECVCE